MFAGRIRCANCYVPVETSREAVEGMPDELDQDLIGTIGQVTLAIIPGRPGEVLLPVRGGTESFSALCEEPVPKNARVVVVECVSGRTVMVTPC